MIASVLNIISIDLGLDYLATITNNIGKTSIVVNGRNIKSINHYYNKKLAKLKSEIGTGTSKRIQILTLKRNNKIRDALHKTSHFIISYCIKNMIDTIVVGSNKNWKQNIFIGKRNNQNFVQIPYDTLLKQIEYKALKEGIKMIITEESYTSKASFLDIDTLPMFNNKKPEKHKFSGERIHRGLYKTANNTLINADVNGSLNIGRKVFLNDLWSDRIEGVVFHPVRFNIG